MPIQLLPEPPAEHTACHCGECNWRGPASALEYIDAFEHRVGAGEVVPAGECPDCRALAYVDQPQVVDHRAAAAMLRALRATADTLAALSAEVEALALPMLDARLSANATAIAAAEAAGITDTEGDQARESAVLDGGAR